MNKLIVTLLILDDVLGDIISSLLQIKNLVYKSRDDFEKKKSRIIQMPEKMFLSLSVFIRLSTRAVKLVWHSFYFKL